MQVVEMFDKIAPTYDRTNRILSLGIDLYWRWKLQSLLPHGNKLKLLDCATGTGDQLLALMKSRRIHQAVGIDLSEEMLKIGRKKLAPFAHQIELKCASGTEIPYLENTFDAVTLSFGIRNIDPPLKCLQEIYRVLRPKGRALILEFSLPAKSWVQNPYLFYLNKVLPQIGKRLSGNREAYSYLARTIQSFPYGEAFCGLLQEAGFQKVKGYPMTGGIVTLYVGEKCS